MLGRIAGEVNRRAKRAPGNRGNELRNWDLHSDRRPFLDGLSRRSQRDQHNTDDCESLRTMKPEDRDQMMELCRRIYRETDPKQLARVNA